MCLQEHLENANPDVFVEDDALELITLVSKKKIQHGSYLLQLTLCNS